MRISLIAAVTRNGAIGLNNQLLCRLPQDLRHFRARTMGRHVIMGRKTYQSLPRTLKGRAVIVVTRQKNYKAPGVCVAPSIEAALEVAQSRQETEVLIAGGAQIYAQTLHKAHTLYLTYIDACLQGDVFFPQPSLLEWTETARQTHAADAQHAHAYAFVTLQRIGTPHPSSTSSGIHAEKRST